VFTLKRRKKEVGNKDLVVITIEDSEVFRFALLDNFALKKCLGLLSHVCKHKQLGSVLQEVAAMP
jgi:hypothetical protein